MNPPLVFKRNPLFFPNNLEKHTVIGGVGSDFEAINGKNLNCVFVSSLDPYSELRTFFLTLLLVRFPDREPQRPNPILKPGKPLTLFFEYALGCFPNRELKNQTLNNDKITITGEPKKNAHTMSLRWRREGRNRENHSQR